MRAVNSPCSRAPVYSRRAKSYSINAVAFQMSFKTHRSPPNNICNYVFFPGLPSALYYIFEGFCLEWSLYSEGMTELEWEAGFLLIVR